MLSQMVPISFFDLDDLRTVVRTFVEAFPHSGLWYNRKELLLIGTVAARIEAFPRRLDLLTSNPRVHADLDFAIWGGPEHHLNRSDAFLAGYLAGPEELRRLSTGARVYRDDRPFLEYTTSLHLSTLSSIGSILDAIRSELASPAGLVPGLDSAATDRIAELRDLNLRNIRANILVDQFVRLDVDDRRALGIPLLRQAVEWNPHNAHANMVLGLALRDYAKQEAEGAEYLRAALRIRPTYATAHFHLARVHRARGEPVEARRRYEAAIRHDPSLLAARYELAMFLLELEQGEAAETHFRELLDAGPRTVEALQGLGRALLFQRRHAEAAAVLEEAQRLAPSRSDVAQALAEARAGPR